MSLCVCPLLPEAISEDATMAWRYNSGIEYKALDLTPSIHPHSYTKIVCQIADRKPGKYAEVGRLLA